MFTLNYRFDGKWYQISDRDHTHLMYRVTVLLEEGASLFIISRDQ